MKPIRKYILFLFVIFFCGFLPANVNGNNCYTVKNSSPSDSVKSDQSRIVFILDGKRVPMEVVTKMIQSKEIENSGSGITDEYPRTAIQLYGQKYRYGLLFFTTKKENDEK